MCGIAGFIDFNKKCNYKTLKDMTNVLHHRGPDDKGYEFLNLNNCNIGLGHRRLSIIDLSKSGKQPMADIDKKIWITYNGEVYNFQNIRKELEAKDYFFKSSTDTEVIINAYKEWGTDCVNKFNGMFAFGIYDSERKIIFLARDRVGKKPLYYYFNDTKFIFASELKSIYIDKSIPKEIDLNAVNYFLTFGYIGKELTIYKNIKKLLPGHCLLFDIHNKKIKIWKYWSIHPFNFSYNTSEEELFEEFKELFEDAVKIRMISDVPLGAFLSGGVDSSLVVATMSKISNSPVKTFSIGFEEKKYNELPFADIVAKHFETDHHRFIVKPDAFKILQLLIKQFDEPFADSSMIPTYYVSKITRDYVTVALSGDGGDEVFAGYTQYLGTLGNYYAYKMLPSFFRNFIAKLAENFPEKAKGKRQLVRLKYNPYYAYLDRISNAYFKMFYRDKIFSKDALDFFYKNDSFLNPESSRFRFFEYFKNDLVNSLSFADFKTYLPDDILVKVDRTSMFVSLEVRAPLLDYRIAEFSFNKIPGSVKLKHFKLKYFLKKIAKQIFPRELNINRKQGFAIPISKWFRGALKNQIEDILLGNNIKLFNKTFIEKLLKEHQKGINHSGRLFVLLVFFLWWSEVHEKN